MFKNIKFTITGDQLFEYLVIFWLISLPFEAKLFPIQLDSITIYPNLVCAVLIAMYSIKTIKMWSKIDWLLISFYSIWIAYALVLLVTKFNHYFALFDLRSLIMQLLFFVVFLNLNYQLSYEKKNELLKNGFKAYLYILLIFGGFEFLTGIHFDGHWVEKFSNLQVNNIFYAPTFVYDNSNDFLCYLLFFYLLNTIFDDKLQQNFYQKIMYLIIIYVFSLYGDSKYAKLIVFLIILFELFLFYRNRFKIPKNIVITGSLILLLVLYFGSKKFYGPIFNNSVDYRLNEIKFIKKEANKFEVFSISKDCTNQEKDILRGKLDSLEVSSEAVSIRKNLIFNGIDFIKEKPILGIGPGNYVKRHIDKKVQYDTNTVTSAHNFVIEIISQYGIIAWTYFAILLLLLIRIIQSKTNFNRNYIILLYIIIPILWMMPSSYLYLDINWLLLPLCYFHFNATSRL